MNNLKTHTKNVGAEYCIKKSVWNFGVFTRRCTKSRAISHHNYLLRSCWQGNMNRIIVSKHKHNAGIYQPN